MLCVEDVVVLHMKARIGIYIYIYRNVNCHVMSCRFACHAMFEILIHAIIQLALPKCSAYMQRLNARSMYIEGLVWCSFAKSLQANVAYGYHCIQRCPESVLNSSGAIPGFPPLSRFEQSEPYSQVSTQDATAHETESHPLHIFTRHLNQTKTIKPHSSRLNHDGRISDAFTLTS